MSVKQEDPAAGLPTEASSPAGDPGDTAETILDPLIDGIGPPDGEGSVRIIREVCFSSVCGRAPDASSQHHAISLPSLFCPSVLAGKP